MITITLQDKETQEIFTKGFNGNQERFEEFIKTSFIDYFSEDSDYIENQLEMGFGSGRSTLTHKELFGALREKYGID